MRGQQFSLPKSSPYWPSIARSQAFPGADAEREQTSSSSGQLPSAQETSPLGMTAPRQTEPATAGPQASPEVHLRAPSLPFPQNTRDPSQCQVYSGPVKPSCQTQQSRRSPLLPVAPNCQLSMTENVSPEDPRHICQAAWLSWKGNRGSSPGPSCHRGENRHRERGAVTCPR